MLSAGYKHRRVQVDLDFDLRPEYTTVVSKLRFIRNAGIQPGPVLLNGRDDMKLTALKLNGHPVANNAYELTDDSLTILKPPDDPFEVQTRQQIGAGLLRALWYITHSHPCLGWRCL